MGILTHYRGNLFDTDKHVLGHCVNCKGAFGAGVAAQIAKRFPDVRRAYMRKFRREGWHLGDCQFVMTDARIIVVNMAMQEAYGRKGKFIDYDAVKICFEKTLDYCKGDGGELAIPRVGSGLAGGDWGEVEAIIRGCLAIRDVEVDVYSLD